MLKKLGCSVAAIALAGCAVGAVASPGALNLIPCVDMMKTQSLRLAFESDGHNQPINNDSTSYVYAQYGLSDKWEVGIDFFGVNNSDEQTVLNAKYLVTKEDGKRPGVALGVWQVGENSKPAYYAVGCKKVMKDTRVHFGVQTQGESTWGMLGMDYALTDNLYFMADWQTGSGKCHTAGFYWTPTPVIGVQVYYARNNSSELRKSDDYLGVYISHDLKLF